MRNEGIQALVIMVAVYFGLAIIETTFNVFNWAIAIRFIFAILIITLSTAYVLTRPQN